MNFTLSKWSCNIVQCFFPASCFYIFSLCNLINHLVQVFWHLHFPLASLLPIYQLYFFQYCIPYPTFIILTFSCKDWLEALLYLILACRSSSSYTLPSTFSLSIPPLFSFFFFSIHWHIYWKVLAYIYIYLLFMYCIFLITIFLLFVVPSKHESGFFLWNDLISLSIYFLFSLFCYSFF